MGASTFRDELTGALSREGFFNVARPYAQVALESHIGLLLASIQICGASDGAACDRDSCDLQLIRTGEVLRNVFDAPALVGRLEQRRFGVLVAGLEERTVETLLNRAASEIEETSFEEAPAAKVRFSVSELDSADAIEDLLSGQCPSEVRWHMKTVILAD
jgi:GGDEF domain-containing protein